jgi:signal transduction histidine kinase
MIHEVNLTEELKLIKMNLQTQIRETKTSIREDFSEAETLQVVRPYLDSILIHLISNAIKFRHPLRKPIIRIKTEVTGKYICLSVKDNGLGIDLSLYKNHLFALYHRFHSHVEGKGIGLFLVKTQVIALRGRIEVKSEVDKGTTFRIYLRSDKPLESKKELSEENVPVQETVKWFNRSGPKKSQ